MDIGVARIPGDTFQYPVKVGRRTFKNLNEPAARIPQGPGHVIATIVALRYGEDVGNRQQGIQFDSSGAAVDQALDPAPHPMSLYGAKPFPAPS